MRVCNYMTINAYMHTLTCMESNICIKSRVCSDGIMCVYGFQLMNMIYNCGCVNYIYKLWLQINEHYQFNYAQAMNYYKKDNY